MSFPLDALASLVGKYRELNQPVQSLGPIMPVVTVADLSKGNSAERFEARALYARMQTSVAPSVPIIGVHANTRDLVVENVSYKGTGVSANTACAFHVEPLASQWGPAPSSSAGNIANIGGLATAFRIIAGSGVNPPSSNAAELPTQNAVWLRFPNNQDLKALVPRGSVCELALRAQGSTLEAVFLLRELV